jgi:formate-dependent nitrite reductase cytochrome c552 subunit
MVRWKLGVDLDRPSELRLLMTYFNGRWAYGKPEVYRTNNGYHFIFDCSTTSDARLGLLDDRKRLYLSELRENLMRELDDVLFEWKWDGKWRKREKVDEKSLLAKPFWWVSRRKRNGKV